VQAVSTAKRSKEYRANRPMLAGPAPNDVWLDPDSHAYHVVFRMRVDRPGEFLLVLAVDAALSAVTSAGTISLKPTSAGWEAHNHLVSAA
jgi:hypothetical protein